MVENAHCDLEGLLRTMRSDPMERTGVSVNVKPQTVSRLLRHYSWSLLNLAIGVDGLTDFKRQCGKDYLGETVCFGEAVCCRVSVRIQSEMEPRWEADGMLLRKLDLYDGAIVDTPKGQLWQKVSMLFRGMEQMRIATDIV